MEILVIIAVLIYLNNLEDLIGYSCAKLRGYLQSPNVSDRTFGKLSRRSLKSKTLNKTEKATG